MTPFAEPAFLQTLLDVEVALAAAEAEVGVIPASCVPDIQAAARAELYDANALAKEAERAGNIIIPLMGRLTDAVAARNPASARYVHYGATSQDIIDTALVLQLRSARATLDDALTRAMTTAAALAREHIATVMPAHVAAAREPHDLWTQSRRLARHDWSLSCATPRCRRRRARRAAWWRIGHACVAWRRRFCGY